MSKVLDCSLERREFELQSGYYIHFWTNTLRKGMNPLFPTIYGLNSNTVVIQGWLWHLITYEG